MRLRDIISHHYDALDHEIIFSVCKESIPELQRVIELMVRDASTDSPLLRREAARKTGRKRGEP